MKKIIFLILALFLSVSLRAYKTGTMQVLEFKGDLTDTGPSAVTWADMGTTTFTTIGSYTWLGVNYAGANKGAYSTTNLVNPKSAQWIQYATGNNSNLHVIRAPGCTVFYRNGGNALFNKPEGGSSGWIAVSAYDNSLVTYTEVIDDANDLISLYVDGNLILSTVSSSASWGTGLWAVGQLSAGCACSGIGFITFFRTSSNVETSIPIIDATPTITPTITPVFNITPSISSNKATVGDSITFVMTYKTVGNLETGHTVTELIGNNFSYVGASPAPDTIIGSNLYWNVPAGNAPTPVISVWGVVTQPSGVAWVTKLTGMWEDATAEITVAINTPTVTPTVTQSSTLTGTITKTVTLTVTSSITETSSSSETPTVTETNTKTITITLTITTTSSSTASQTPTSTITPTFVLWCKTQWAAVTPVNVWTVRDKFIAITASAKVWTIAGTQQDTIFYADVYNSSNGADWTCLTKLAEFEPRYSHVALNYDSKLWVISGWNGTVYFGDAWSSNDGITWLGVTRTTAFMARHEAAGIVWNNKMWIISGAKDDELYMGNLNDAWYSSDGIDWTAATRDAEFQKRIYHGIVVWKNKLWIMGGENPQTSVYLNDVWFTSNGAYWTRATSNAGWPAGRGKNCFVKNNILYVYDDASAQIWSTKNGVRWEKLRNIGAIPSLRIQSACLLFGNVFFTFGGYGDVYGPADTNDAWKTDINKCIGGNLYEEPERQPWEW